MSKNEPGARIYIESNNKRGQELLAAIIEDALNDQGFSKTVTVSHPYHEREFKNNVDTLFDQVQLRNPSFFNTRIEISVNRIEGDDVPPDDPNWTQPIEHPIQPVVFDALGTARFKKNHIVDFLTEGRLNELASMEFPREDREQLAQLIGYSVNGFGDLSYASQKVVDQADAAVNDLLTK